MEARNDGMGIAKCIFPSSPAVVVYVDGSRVRLGVKGHLLFDLKTRELLVSRDVVFYEHIFPYLHNPSPTSTDSTQHAKPISPSSSYNFLFDMPHLSHPSPPEISSPPIDPHPQPALPQPFPRRSQRQKNPHSYLQDYHCSLLSATTHNSTPSISSNIRYHISNYISYHRLSHTHRPPAHTHIRGIYLTIGLKISRHIWYFCWKFSKTDLRIESKNFSIRNG